MLRIMVVDGGEHLIALAQRQTVIDKREASSRVLRQRNVLRVAADVVCHRLRDLQRQVSLWFLKHRPVHRKKRIVVQYLPVPLDGLAHRPRMRSNVKQT